ncbi:hypothetical protein [Salidesulfovibrio onnuriiensis]|uniref:hypothetical protein n=1 Tax=Salidesulfovibrio onnuriiensis TaxID=2583823 RepID=UPI0011CBA9A8|nr:hypothetical protein [Salidesulfovibrio onnuriiensis]
MDDITVLKGKVMDCFRFCEALNARAVHELVLERCPAEGGCSLPAVREQLRELKDEGLLSLESTYVDDNGSKVPVYRISEAGLDLLHRGQA